MTTQIGCTVPPGATAREFDPFPGSHKAKVMGCTCPDKQPWPKELVFSLDCPIHQLEKIKSQ